MPFFILCPYMTVRTSSKTRAALVIQKDTARDRIFFFVGLKEILLIVRAQKYGIFTSVPSMKIHPITSLFTACNASKSIAGGILSVSLQSRRAIPVSDMLFSAFS